MRTVSFSEQSASRPAGRPERAHDAGRDDGNSADGSASHGGDGITNASHSRAQHGGGMRVHHSLAQRAQQRENGANEPRRGVQPFLRASPPHPARDGSARGVAPSTARRNDQLQASRYNDAGFVALGRPPPSAPRRRQLVMLPRQVAKNNLLCKKRTFIEQKKMDTRHKNTVGTEG